MLRHSDFVIKVKRILEKIVDVRGDEVRASLLAFVFNFAVLGGYYVIRPIRDEIGADRGVENLPWMYTGTLVGMLIANALYAAIVARMSRRRFIPIAYRFAIVNLFVFFLLMRTMPVPRNVRSNTGVFRGRGKFSNASRGAPESV